MAKSRIPVVIPDYVLDAPKPMATEPFMGAYVTAYRGSAMGKSEHLSHLKDGLHPGELAKMNDYLEYLGRLRDLGGTEYPQVNRNPLAHAVKLVVQGRLDDLRNWFDVKEKMWWSWINCTEYSGVRHRLISWFTYT
ncbi:hypothetical protein AVT69_gp252 [Pseudomonas phage PhiPA3]|uniref:Uncharacterized protein 254 n=1 Tax=Pseudomonas phage PhiPA3 TaxID=998086 RepID=F8SJ95_BPPA3|nr:hypothetical protein AVT69_gp252 [Pseudomonas phage PhiPA3]AEH03677.1 hypothetical protein [Pseudomonas phage PhiPA3]